MSDEAEPVYSRAPDVVWRLGPDRVLVRRIGVRGEDAAAELLGDAALVWIALDEPGAMSHLLGRVEEVAAKKIGSRAVTDLRARDWVESSP